METHEILAEVTGGENTLLVGDMVEGRGEMVGVITRSLEDGDLEVRWEDGELWTYPPAFLTLSLREPAQPTEPAPPSVPSLPPCLDPRLTTDSDARKRVPLASGCFDYFPDALAAVAELSYRGNEKHNPGQPLHWARGKSTDEADCLLRHLLERGAVDTDGIRHSVKVAWRALALLQKELEAVQGLPISRGSRP